MIHEVSHGYAANWLGDQTAKYEGRLTLNPLKHLDMFGSVILPLLLVLGGSNFLIGWAKPVPFNPYNLRDRRWGEAIVAIAGPLSNIFIALVFGLLLRFSLATGYLSDPNIVRITAYIVLINLVLAVFNLIPVPPLDGSKIIFSIFNVGYGPVRIMLERYGLVLVLLMAYFLWPLISPVISIVFSLITGVNI